MRNDYYSYSKDYINRWVISYADFITMLLALFMVLWAISGNTETHKPAVKINQSLNINSTKELPADNTITEQDEIIDTLNQNEVIKQNAKVLKGVKGAIIRLNDKMLFEQGSAIIKPEVLSTLDNIANELKKFDNYIIIEGHTDSTPISTSQFPSNWELSTARATNIIKYLVAKKEFNPQKLSAVGYGEYMPIAPNTSYEGKTLNRRVDIIIISSNKTN